MELKKIVKDIGVAFGIIVDIFIIVFSLIIFQHRIGVSLFKRSIQNITEIQQLYKQMISNKFEDQFSLLETQSKYFEEGNKTEEEKRENVLKFSKASGEFKKLALINSDGTGIDFSGKTVPNIRNRIYFREAVESSQRSVSEQIELDSNLKPVLTLLYPVKNRTDLFILGTISYDILRKMFDVPIFSGKSYSYIVNKEGNIVLCNKDKKKALYNINFYDYIKSVSTTKYSVVKKMKNDIQQELSGWVICTSPESEKLFSYTSLGINDWTLITVLPISYIRKQQTGISILVFVVIAVIGLMLMIIIFLVYLMLRHNSIIERDNERLVTVNNQTQTLCFEFDITKDIIDFSGETKFILGTEKKQLPAEFVRSEHFRRIHPDDGNILDCLHESITQKQDSYTAEFRYKGYDNEYFWCRLSGSFIFSDDGRPVKFIGSISNVNSQVLHELKLKELAECDKLTKLLNKTTMESKIKKYLNESVNGKLCAFIIVDLDNFKSINDYLGHMTGDMAIRDAAKKLSLVFSEKDYIGRFGGDEFCVLMRFSEYFTKDSVIKVLKEKGESLCNILQEDYFNEDSTVCVSASIGMAVYPYDGLSYEELFACADSALYDVKKSGKNAFKIYDGKRKQ